MNMDFPGKMSYFPISYKVNKNLSGIKVSIFN